MKPSEYREIIKVFTSKHYRLRDSIFITLNFLIVQIISMPLIFASYLGLALHESLYLWVRNLHIQFLMAADHFWRSDLYATEKNLTQLLGIQKNHKEVKKIAKTSTILRYFQDAEHHDWYFRLTNKRRFVRQGKSMLIKNHTGIPLEKIGIDRKVIFCHSHSNNMIFSILKIGSLTHNSLKTLLVQRSYTKIMYTFLDNIAQQLNARHLEYYDPFLNSPISLMKKVKKSDIIHLYVDLPIYTSLKNFSSTEITLFGKQASINDSAARLAVGFDALCIPLFVNNNEIHLLKPIDCHLFKGSKDEKITQSMQQLFTQLSHYWIQYPDQWYMLRNSEYFFKKTTFYKGN